MIHDYPADPGEPLLRFTPPLPGADGYTPDECAVFEIAADHGGVIVFSRYGTRWEANSGERFVIAYLLSEAAELRKKIGGVLDGAEAAERAMIVGCARAGFAGTNPCRHYESRLTVYDDLRRALDLLPKEGT